MMIQCNECQNAVSDRAATCPHCGNPIGSGMPGIKPQTIEQTGKRWKTLQALAVVSILVSIPWFMFAAGIDDSRHTGLALSTGLAGLGLWFLGRLGAWWHHG